MTQRAVGSGTKKTVFRAPLKDANAENWGADYKFYYKLDFSPFKIAGRYFVKIENSGVSREFSIGEYAAYQEDLLFFMRQQRCGYNPYLDMVCHQRDGRTFSYFSAVTTLGTLPLIILSARLDDTADHAASQAGFLQLSTNSQQLFAEPSGHRIMMDQPEAAVAAITQMVEQVRQSIKSSSSASQNHP